ncbi:MAG: hypothetical protein ACE5IK_03175 [Acidobacteriota bacterium]
MTRRPRNRRVVRQPDRIQTRLLLLGLAAGVIILVPLLGNVWGHAEAVHLGYQIEQARHHLAALQATNRLLRTEHAALTDLARIERLATGKLGLQPRRPADTVVVDRIDPENPPQDAADGLPRIAASRASSTGTEAR